MPSVPVNPRKSTIQAKDGTMSRAWINFYMGDFQKKTSHLDTLETGAYLLLLMECWINGRIPLEAERRARIAKLSLKEWNRISPIINPFFQDDGTNKRATEEITKVDDARVRRGIAAQKAGRASGIARAIASSRYPPIERNVERTLSNRSSSVQRLPNSDEPNLEKNITTSLSDAAREVRDEQNRLSSLSASDELKAILNGKPRR